MSVVSPVETPSGLGRAWEIVSDLMIATALIWAAPLLLGVAVALFTFLFR